MIEHVVRCAMASAARTVTVATDSAQVEETVRQFDGNVVMTSPEHPSGTDRVAEAAARLKLSDQEIVVNVQGDEPEMPSALIDQVSQLLAQKPQSVVATASAPLDSRAQLTDPSVVKVVTDADGYAIYFSRATIPWVRDAHSSALADNAVNVVRRHLGIYAYRCGYLKRLAGRQICELERYEKLEQLRILWHGEKIACAHAVEIPGPGVDTLEDLERVRRLIAP